jgi:MoxR-like ATPase
LADEINRSPPKVQSALLECMEEKQVTIEGDTHKLEAPFFVMATQNPIELEGTYPLPEAQMDRFLIKLSTGYVNSLEKEYLILKRRNNWMQDDPTDLIEPVATNETFHEMQTLIERDVHIDDQILMYISDIVRKTRENQYVEVGSSPRGGLSLSKISKALAVVHGRDFVTPDDVKFVVQDVLAHRIILKMEYELDRQTDTREVIKEIVEKIEPPIDVVRR